MHKTKMVEGWKIHQIQEIQPLGQCAVVCEDMSTSVLVFFHINDLMDKEAVFQPLAQHITNKKHSIVDQNDPIQNYQSVMCYQ